MCDWPSIVTAVSTAIGVIVVIVAGFFAWCQLRGLKQQTTLSVFLQIYNHFNSEELRKDRRSIYQTPTEKLDLSSIEEELYLTAQRVLTSWNEVGFLVHKHMVPVDEALAQLMGPPVIKSWDKLKKLTNQERSRRKEPAFCKFFEELASNCRSKLPGYESVYFSNRESRTNG